MPAVFRTSFGITTWYFEETFVRPIVDASSPIDAGKRKTV